MMSVVTSKQKVCLFNLFTGTFIDKHQGNTRQERFDEGSQPKSNCGCCGYVADAVTVTRLSTWCFVRLSTVCRDMRNSLIV